MARRKVLKAWRAAIAIVCFLVSRVKVEAQMLNELIAGAKKESEIAFIAGATTFGGPKAFSEFQAVFNKKFGLNARINLTAGPSMAATGSKDCMPWDQSAMW
jgi:hypothetical protein